MDHDQNDRRLDELKADVEKSMNWEGDSYYYNGNVNIIEQLFQAFFNVTNVDTLKTNLIFILKANGKSLYGYANSAFSNGTNIERAVEYYLTQVKNQSNLQLVENQLRDECIKALVGEDTYSKLQHIIPLIDSSMENEKVNYLGKLIELLIPERIKTMQELGKLSQLWLVCSFFYTTHISYVRAYITSTEDTHKTYIQRIIYSLKDATCGNRGLINEYLNSLSSLKYMQSFFNDILYHPNVIAHTKSIVNDVYKDTNLRWTERTGILISRVFNILTPEISEHFCSILNKCVDGGRPYLISGVCEDLIEYFIVFQLTIEELPQVDKPCFWRMVTDFVIPTERFPFTSDQRKLISNILQLIVRILNGELQPEPRILECITAFICVLLRAGIPVNWHIISNILQRIQDILNGELQLEPRILECITEFICVARRAGINVNGHISNILQRIQGILNGELQLEPRILECITKCICVVRRAGINVNFHITINNME